MEGFVCSQVTTTLFGTSFLKFRNNKLDKECRQKTRNTTYCSKYCCFDNIVLADIYKYSE